MRIMINTNGHLQIIQINDIYIGQDGWLHIPITPYGLPLVICGAYNPAYVLTQLSAFGWIDLSMYPANYINQPYNTDSDDIGREIEPFEFER